MVATASSAITTNPEINRRFMETPVWLEIQSVAYATRLRPTDAVRCDLLHYHDLVLAVSAEIACAARFNSASEAASDKRIVTAIERCTALTLIVDNTDLAEGTL